MRKIDQIFIVSLAFLAPSFLLAQIPQSHSYSAVEAAHILTGSSALEHLGFSVSGGGDINSDGHADFIVGAPDYNGLGRVFVVDGRTGQILFQVSSQNSGSSGRFGASVANAGDFDGDSFEDWVVGDPGDDSNGEDAGRVFVFSGRDASLLRIYECDRMPGEKCGASIAGNCRYDNNASPDLLVTAQGGGAGGKVYVYSGSRNDALRSFESSGADDEFGYQVSCSGDFDGNSFDDILIGAPGYLENSGAAWIYSGQTGELLGFWEGAAGDRLGQAVALVGDLDGDFADEILVGAPQETGPGYAWIISSQTGVPDREIIGMSSTGEFGAALTRLGDVNQDGTPDLLIGDPHYKNGRGQVYIYSGADASPLYQFEGEAFQDLSPEFGRSLYAAGDANADSIPDIIVGAPKNSAATLESGRAYLFYVRPKLIEIPGAPEEIPSENNDEEIPDQVEEEPAVCEEIPELKTIEDFILAFDAREKNFSNQDIHKFQNYLIWLQIKRVFKSWFHPYKSKPKHNHKAHHKKESAKKDDKGKKDKKDKHKNKEKDKSTKPSKSNKHH